MDTLPVIEIATPQREDVRDHRGTIIGRVERQNLTGRIIVRDHRGIVLGWYDLRSNKTRDALGQLIGRGNLLGALLMRGR